MNTQISDIKRIEAISFHINTKAAILGVSEDKKIKAIRKAISAYCRGNTAFRAICVGEQTLRSMQ